MVETVILWTVIAICGFFTGRRFYRQWKAAADKNSKVDCGSGCTCCSDTSCDGRKPQ